MLRQRRRVLVSNWVSVSYAIGALSLGLEMLNRHQRPHDDHLQAIIDDLPDRLAREWDISAWSLTLHTSDLIAAAVEAVGLLDLHEEVVTSDLEDPDVAHSLFRPD